MVILKNISCALMALLCIPTCLCFTEPDSTLVSRTFTKHEVCHLQDRIDLGCAEFQEGLTSLLRCSALCDENCLGVYSQSYTTCYFARPCEFTFLRCNTGDEKVLFYVKSVIKVCQHDSVYDEVLDTCKCIDGWVGESCERLPKHCGELRDYGYPTSRSGIGYNVQLDLDNYPTPIHVRCDMYDHYQNTILMASSGMFSNNKTWSQYYDGFIYDEDNFWIGLDKIKALNDAGLTTLYLNVNFTDQNGEDTQFMREFNNFQLNNASEGFAFTFSTSQVYSYGPHAKSLSYGDCLRPTEGGKFSTWDNDNDEVLTENCAAQAGVGWWFKDCNMTCNPLGWNYLTKPGPETKSHMKMDGIDFESQTYARTSHVMMYFFSHFLVSETIVNFL